MKISRLAIEEALLSYIQTQLMSSDAGEPEVVLYREDSGAVSEHHIEVYLAEIVDRIETLKAEIEQWGELEVNFNPQEDHRDDDEDEEEAADDEDPAEEADEDPEEDEEDVPADEEVDEGGEEPPPKKTRTKKK